MLHLTGLQGHLHAPSCLPEAPGKAHNHVLCELRWNEGLVLRVWVTCVRLCLPISPVSVTSVGLVLCSITGMDLVRWIRCQSYNPSLLCRDFSVHFRECMRSAHLQWLSEPKHSDFLSLGYPGDHFHSHIVRVSHSSHCKEVVRFASHRFLSPDSGVTGDIQVETPVKIHIKPAIIQCKPACSSVLGGVVFFLFDTDSRGCLIAFNTGFWAVLNEGKFY